METDESIEIGDLHVRFNAYGSTINAEGNKEEEIVNDEEVDRCNHLMLIQIVGNSSLLFFGIKIFSSLVLADHDMQL